MTSTYQHRHRRRLQLVIAMLLAMVMCWVGERASLVEALHHEGAAAERSQTDTSPVGMPAGPNVEGFADKAKTADDADSDALIAVAAPIEDARCFSLRHSDRAPELNDWRARSSIGARGPPVV